MLEQGIPSNFPRCLCPPPRHPPGATFDPLPEQSLHSPLKYQPPWRPACAREFHSYSSSHFCLNLSTKLRPSSNASELQIPQGLFFCSSINSHCTKAVYPRDRDAQS